MKDNGNKTKQMEMVPLNTKMGQHTKVNGKITDKMDSVFTNGHQASTTQEVGLKDTSKAMENSSFLTEATTKETLMATNFTDKVYTSIKIEDKPTKECGSTIKSQDSESSRCRTAQNTKVSSNMTRCTVMVN